MKQTKSDKALRKAFVVLRNQQVLPARKHPKGMSTALPARMKNVQKHFGKQIIGNHLLDSAKNKWTCPMSLNYIPTNRRIIIQKQAYDANSLAELLLSNSLPNNVPHTREPITQNIKNNILQKASPPYKTKLVQLFQRVPRLLQELETRLLESPHPPPHDMEIWIDSSKLRIRAYDTRGQIGIPTRITRPPVSYWLSISYAPSRDYLGDSGDLFLSFTRGGRRSTSRERLREMIIDISRWLRIHMVQPYLLPYLLPQGPDLLRWRTYAHLPPQALMHLGGRS
jgi:hypothetical protein